MHLILVTTRSWEDSQGTLKIIEEDKMVGQPIPVVLGKNGMAWGNGLHSLQNCEGPRKKEGDKKSPAGIFRIGPRFGFAAWEDSDYFQITPDTVLVDDVHSSLYNQIVNRSTASAAFNSCEEMYSQPLYEQGAVIQHNYPRPIPGEGSAIFFHLWKNKDSPTDGCIAMSLENLQIVLNFIRDKNPLFVQVPIGKWKKEWGQLLEISKKSSQELNSIH